MAKTIRIGHASTNSPSSGSAADEVLISNYYTSLKPTVVLRPKTRELAEKSAAACEAGCNNNNIEYSQATRNTLNTEAKKVGYNLSNVKTKCYADCSSFMTVCAIAGGAKISYTAGAPNCGNMKSVFTKSGDYTALTAATYLNSSDYLLRGDILVRENYLNGSRHTVMVLDNGGKMPTTVVAPEEEPQVDIAQEAYTAVKVNLAVTDITGTGAKVAAKLTKIKNGKESALSTSAIKQYKWSYTLETLDTDTKKAEKLRVSSSKYNFSLVGLLPGYSYRVSITATEDDSDAEFYSPSIIFTTPKRVQKYDNEIDFNDTQASTKKCKVFLKVKDAFKRVIFYHKEV